MGRILCTRLRGSRNGNVLGKSVEQVVKRNKQVFDKLAKH